MPSAYKPSSTTTAARRVPWIASVTPTTISASTPKPSPATSKHSLYTKNSPTYPTKQTHSITSVTRTTPPETTILPTTPGNERSPFSPSSAIPTQLTSTTKLPH